MPLVAEPQVMAKKQPEPEPTPEPDAPVSESVRIAFDLVEKMRDICHHSKDPRGRRVKIGALLDSYLRERVEREHAALQARLAAEKKDKG